jgi:hypothetical protein
LTSTAKSGDDNGNNDNHSSAVAALAEYLNLWSLSLGSSVGQYTSLFGNLPAAGDGLYHSGGGSGDRREMVIERMLQ